MPPAAVRLSDAQGRAGASAASAFEDRTYSSDRADSIPSRTSAADATFADIRFNPCKNTIAGSLYMNAIDQTLASARDLFQF
jgi:hypothetical protein